MSSLSSRERWIESKLTDAISGVTPGVVLQAFHRGQLICDLRVGKTYHFYDWASLTKIVFMTSNFIRLHGEGHFNPAATAERALSWHPFCNITFKSLFSHSSGHIWWMPFYKHINLKLSLAERRIQLERMLRKAKPSRSTKAVYSDINALLLGFALERIQEAALMDIWNAWSEACEFENTHFHLNNKPLFARSHYAPTEACPWRNKTLQGEVHDDNTWSFGGISSHAGLFGPIEDLAKWGLGIRHAYRGGRDWILKPESVRLFTKRAVPKSVGDWALGFMMPSEGKASCGKYFDSTSFGHTGFTGTSFWYDPKKDLMVLILSNRVHPTRENARFVQLRPQIHDWIVETYMKE